jgi:S-DNA-T family DNA segregation ATPase FtsK/SpoIIIE
MKSIRIALSPTGSRPLNVFLGLVLSLVSLLLILALATYSPADPSLNSATSLPAHNWAGLFGAWFSDLLLQSLGITAFFLPIWLAGIGWTWMQSRSGDSPVLRWVGAALALLFLPTAFALLPWHWRWLHQLPIEGVLGRLMADLLVRYLNQQGTWLVAGVLALAGLYFACAVSFWALKESIQDRWLHAVSWHDRWRNWREQRAEHREERRAQREAAAHPDGDRDLISSTDPVSYDAQSVRRPGFFASLFGRRTRTPDLDPLDEIPAYQRARFDSSSEEIPVAAPAQKLSIWERTASAPPTPAPSNVVPMQPRPQPAVQKSGGPGLDSETWDTTTPNKPNPQISQPIGKFEPTPHPNEAIAIHNRADANPRAVTVAPKNVSGFKLPPSTLLQSGEAPQTIREEELREEARALVEKCAEFDVRGQVVQINPGPMVTTYEFKPDPGVKYSRVTTLDDDLCLAMRAESILIERMAGKSTVGIQVPNRERETIHLRDIVESETFHKAKSRLTLAMGKDINGRIVTADLASMPHVLIAGSTGSGKSVAINAMIMSLLFRTTPAQVRLILVDPKRVELGMYEGVPHLFTPIITQPKLAANALRNAVREMERRLKLLASRSVRNIDQYNKLFESSMPSLFDEAEDNEPLPYIVIIIDELADLMMLDRSNVEESITRLAQMARAVGIHLILATQRPSVDVITGLIKANIPTRISFRLATKVDSRTILDTNGAESLLGRGDMLFLPPGTSRLMRLHAPYVSEKETAAVVAFWKNQGEAEYVESFLEAPKDDRVNPDGSNPDPEENDPMFDDAVRLVFEFGKASTSLLQRRLRIGYGRAAHLIDLM